MISKFKDISMIQEVLHEAMTGLWMIELEDGKSPRMYADPTMLELLGLDFEPAPEECYNSWDKNIVDEYRPLVSECVNKIISIGRAEVEYSWIHPKLGKIFVRCGGVPDCSYSAGIRLRGYHQNVTDVIMLRQEKEKLEELNQEIIGSLHNLFFSVFRIDINKNSIKAIRIPEDIPNFVNQELPYADFLENYAANTFHPDDCPQLCEDFSLKHFHSLIEKGIDRFSREYRRKFKDGYHWVSCNIYFEFKNQTSNWGILALQDINEQKQKEEESHQALINAFHMAQSANYAKSDFLSRMSHDIRTPINAIIGMAKLAQHHVGDEEKLISYFEKIDTSSKLLLSLVNEVLDMNTIENGNFKLNKSSFSLPDLLNNIISIIHPSIDEKQQHLEFSTKNLIHTDVIGDALRLEQIFMNILTNANKYTGVNGIIQFIIEELPSETLHTARYCFTCEDNGIGMSQEFLKKIFDPFIRADDSRISKISGTGLGMTITKNLVQMMDGTIQVESKLSKGSRFIVVLELYLQEKKQEPQIKIDINSLNLQNKHLLLVEDNELNREIAQEFLEMSGAEVHSVVNGKEAVDCFSESSLYYYDAIFMDIQMPVMNGNEAAAAIRSLDRKDAPIVPIIAMTANAFTQDILQSKQSGMNEHLTKPIQLSQLAFVLKKWVKTD